ncbi:hypothetical protein Scep_002692 [Stephania cephalantha]|uniref:Uncharacterized protein n=1 Tax=Stephania cephalantha TaxID=152367 RepID=A0AAP0Q908_9MAGN
MHGLDLPWMYLLPVFKNVSVTHGREAMSNVAHRSTIRGNFCIAQMSSTVNYRAAVAPDDRASHRLRSDDELRIGGSPRSAINKDTSRVALVGAKVRPIESLDYE